MTKDLTLEEIENEIELLNKRKKDIIAKENEKESEKVRKAIERKNKSKEAVWAAYNKFLEALYAYEKEYCGVNVQIICGEELENILLGEDV